MTDLQEKLSRATEPSRELDKEIWQLLVPGVTRRTTHVDHHVKPYDIDETRDASGKLIIVPHYTSSLDAALALVAEKLPGWWVDLGVSIDGTFECTAGLDRQDARPWDSIYTPEIGAAHKSPTIALLIALLSALQAKDQS